ncbi:hypothetical protein BsWGS_18023 [Bradybaena similaris]
MTRDAYDVSLRRASQISHRLDILRSPQAGRRPSRVSAYIAKRSLMREDFQGSDRTLVASSLDSNNSSRSNIHTSASSSYYTNSSTDVAGSEKADDDADMDEDDDADSREKPEELETDKGTWEKKAHYVFLSFGAVFGVRNILSFPALAMEHGGGAFLFTYIMLAFGVGLPIVYLEVSLGQYARGGVVKTWRILSLAKGISVCSLLLTLARASYSSTPVVWSLCYLYSGIVGSLPGQRSSTAATDVNPAAEAVHLNQTANMSAFYHRQIFNTSSQFLNTTLEVTDSISNMGRVVPHVLAALLLFWAVVCSLSALGPRLIGKISVCFTVIPSIFIAIIFFAVCTMPGSVVGLQSLLNPRWHHLANFKPWLDVLDFVLSSLSCGTGVIITLSGHCNFHGNTFRSAILLTVLSITMTFISGCLMFSLLGAESRLSGIHVHQDNMTRLSDVELGFVLLPTVMTDLPYPNLWRSIFYLALLLLGVVHATLMVYNFQQGVIDLAHLDKANLHWKTGILGGVVVLMMALNIFTTAQNGLHVFRLLQLSVSRLSMPLLCVAQCVTVGWGYGARRFAGRITEMTGRNKSFLWKLLWRWGCPALLSLVMLASLLTVNILHDLPQKDKNKTWLHGFAWSLSIIILLPGIGMAIASLFSVRGTLKQRLKQLRTTPSTWGPGHPEHEPQADLPDYVICQPDPFRPANALAMLTANLYLPNIVNFVNMRSSPTPVQEPAPAFISDVATLTSSEDDASMGTPSSKESFFTRCQATVSCLSHVVGIGNVVRFPYLAYRNGGGAFLVAYFTVLVTCGIPLVVIETSIGQFSNFGPISVWRAVPVFKGVGYSMVIVSLVTSVYYSVITSWTMFYLATSLTSVMPWQGCSNTWNTNSCRPHDLTFRLCHIHNQTVIDNETGQSVKCLNSDDPTCPQYNLSLHSGCSDLVVPNVNAGKNNGTVSPSDEYFYLGVLKVSESWNHVGELRWQLVLCLLLTWTVVTLFLAKCFKPGKKVTYLILILTCSLLVILLIRISSVVGGHEGLNLLFTPDWGRLIHGHVWRDAVSQVFFSLSLGSGTLIIMGTYNKFNNDLFREAILLCVMDGVVSLLSSLVIFAVVGVTAHAAGLATEAAARADLGLAFVAISTAALQLPWPLFWTILVFLMLVLLGIFTCVSAMATAVASIMDTFSPALKKQRVWLTLCLCSGSAVLGLPMIVQAGFYVVDIIDTHLSGLPQACVGGMVCIAFAWVYGLSQFSRDVKRMTNSSVGFIWKILWLLVCPCITAMLIFSSLASLTSENNDLKHPWWATTIGLVMWFLLLVPIIAGIIHEMSRHKAEGLMERFRKACQPKKEWGATLNRSTSVVEYYPTVHTHLGLDISRDGLNTVAGLKKVKKPLDMRHKAILNHAYSNPQCDVSSGSLDKLGKHKRYPLFLTNGNFQDVIVVKRVNKAVTTCDASTQTDSVLIDSKLCRQRSQPAVHVTKPVVILTRASSWHHLGGQPAILQVSSKPTDTPRSTPEKIKPAAAETPRRRRLGQSVAPNLCLLITQEESHTDEDQPGVHQIRFATLPEVTLLDSSGHLPESPTSPRRHKASTASEGDDALEDNAEHGEHTQVGPRHVTMVVSHSQPNIYTRKRPKLRESASGKKGGRSKSVDETPANTRRHYDRYGPSQGIDNLSFYGRARSGSEAGRPAKDVIRSWLHDHKGSFHGSVDRSGRRESNVIMEEDVVENEEDKFDIDSRLQFIQAEAEIIKM